MKGNYCTINIIIREHLDETSPWEDVGIQDMARADLAGLHSSSDVTRSAVIRIYGQLLRHRSTLWNVLGGVETQGVTL